MRPFLLPEAYTLIIPVASQRPLTFYSTRMDEALKSIIEEAKTKTHELTQRAQFEAIKAEFVGPNGSFTALRKEIGKLPKEQRPEYGKKINGVKVSLEGILNAALERIEEQELAAKIGPAIDPTLPSPDMHMGSEHPLTQVLNRIVDIFSKVGFTVAAGTEVESEYFCFDALNTPADHPARDMQDTYYIGEKTSFQNIKRKADERYVLRPHTSSVQIRTMLKEKPPLKILSPGRVFRRDTADATHSANFHQIEGLLVDKNIKVTDLKAILDYFARELLGKDAKVRFRPHFFPYTEPSFEVDFSAEHLGKVGKKWIEIMGCGMVDPTVFEAVDIDPDEYTGYAFGMGIERIAMIAYGVDDIRYFYQNDQRFLEQFSR